MRWALLGLVFLLGCGARTGLLYDQLEGVNDQDATLADSGKDAPYVCDDDGGDASDASDAGDGGDAPSCTGLACRVDACEGGGHTTLSGTVYDPAAANPIYDVFVYVPNAPLDPIPDGPACLPCAAPASGQPITSAITDARGHFVLTDVPSGANVPLVMQIGKWRRQIILPNVTACTGNVLSDKNMTRLPRKQSEGDIPRIALTTGCDQVECFLLNRIGLDPSEFTGPNGTGRVHVYRGQDDQQGLPPAPGNAYDLWGNLAKLQSYDILAASCECSVIARDSKGPAYANMRSYLNGGGRVFATHYHYNWFANAAQCNQGNGPCGGPPEFASVADWGISGNVPTTQNIDISHPRGKALADWLSALGATPVYGKLDLTDLRSDVGTVYGNGTRWIYAPDGSLYDTFYLSFNTPVGSKAACGRAVFSDIHVTGSYASQLKLWPASCSVPDANSDHTKNEIALEFLFFDLATCIQDDTRPPRQPCGK